MSAKSPKSNPSAISALARALIPPPLGQSAKRELYEQAGRAVVELSNAENVLAVIFCILSIPVSMEAATEMFASQGAFDRKLKLVNFMALHANHSEETEVWSKIYGELNAHRGVRNLIAHQRMLVNYATDMPEIEVSLTPLFYKRKGKALRATDIKATADELEKINGQLWKLVHRLGEPK